MNREQPAEICGEHGLRCGAADQTPGRGLAWAAQLRTAHAAFTSLASLLEMAFLLDFMVISEAIAFAIFSKVTVCVSLWEVRRVGAERQPGPGRHGNGVGFRQLSRHLFKEQGPPWYHTKDAGPAGRGFCQQPRWRRRKTIPHMYCHTKDGVLNGSYFRQ